ncbi:hypothetical protein NUACC21_27240 [Scytonema sp. NUACC21]
MADKKHRTVCRWRYGTDLKRRQSGRSETIAIRILQCETLAEMLGRLKTQRLEDEALERQQPTLSAAQLGVKAALTLLAKYCLTMS